MGRGLLVGPASGDYLKTHRMDGSVARLPPHPNPLPEGEGTNNRLRKLPLPMGEGRGEGCKHAFEVQLCYNFQLAPNFETVSPCRPHCTRLRQL